MLTFLVKKGKMNLSRVSHYFLRIREKTLSQVSSSIGCLVVTDGGILCSLFTL